MSDPTIFLLDAAGNQTADLGRAVEMSIDGERYLLALVREAFRRGGHDASVAILDGVAVA